MCTSTFTQGSEDVMFLSRPRVLDDEEEDGSDADSDFVDQEAPQQSLEEASAEDHSDDSDFAAAKKPKQPTRKLAARNGAARTGVYKDASSGEEHEAGSSSGVPSLHIGCPCWQHQHAPGS